MPENDPYHYTEFKDLRYKSESAFVQGREGYKDKKNNPYFKYQHDYRADWFVGFLYQQRISYRAEK